MSLLMAERFARARINANLVGFDETHFGGIARIGLA